MRKGAFYKDIVRTLKRNFSRFVAIVAMAALGIGVFSGFAVGCLDALRSADRFLDRQKTYDIKMMSTQGLTQADVASVRQISGVDAANGSFSLEVNVRRKNGDSVVASLTAMNNDRMNAPYVVRGKLPSSPGQLAVNAKFLEDTGLKLGDSVMLTPQQDQTTLSKAIQGDQKSNTSVSNKESAMSMQAASLNEKKYMVTAEILSPLDISSKTKGISNISTSSGSSKYLLYASAGSIKGSIYDSIYLTVKEAAKLDSYSTQYHDLVNGVEKDLQAYLLKKHPKATWYVWDREDNDSISGIKKDISFIQGVTRVFPILFFLVAILISLTTMTRMVEEDRGLVGTYKSLGYTNLGISMKYVIYGVSACVVGGLFGSLIGFIIIPKVIGAVVGTLYALPVFYLDFRLDYGIGGFGLFLIGIAGATLIACEGMLHHKPAELMRPKAPKAGNRILLERLGFLWKRLSFLNKVTCRNLFRYKKRAVMTIAGISGCTMLILLGFGVKDSVGGLMSDQYGKVTVYDAIVAADSNSMKSAGMNSLEKEWERSGKVKDILQMQMQTMTLTAPKGHTDITVMVVPDGAEFNRYVHLRDDQTLRTMKLPRAGIVVTRNAAKKLKLVRGSKAGLQNGDHIQKAFSVSFVTTNYAGNYVYISNSCYQAAFGDYHENSFFMNFMKNIDQQKWLAALKADKRILNVSSTQKARDDFKDMNQLINLIVYLLISMSAVLALAVLFTLSNINISERERELATIKVLGFEPAEVYSYVNRETLILTLFGIFFGLPAGYAITYGILANVSIADVAFHVRVSPLSYGIASLITMIFALLVNRITNRSLHRINMVEALKSVE